MEDKAICKTVPKLRFPEFREAGEWEEKDLEDILIKNSTKNKDAKYSLVQSVSNKYGFINQDEYFENRRVASKDTSNYYIIKSGYFAYNPSRIDVGSLAYKHDSKTSIISPLYVSFKAKNDLVTDKFLLNWFSSESFTKQMIFEGGVRNTLNFENLIQIKIKLPSLIEQQKIASCLSSLDDLITAQTQKLETLKTHKKGLMQQLFPAEGETVPKLRFPEFQEAGEWEEKRLIDVVEKKTKWSFIGGPFGSNLKASDYVVSGIRVIQLQNIGDGEFIDNYKIFTSEQKADELLSCNIYPGDIILSKMGDPVGRACLIPNIHSRYVMCSDGIRLVVDEKRFNKYLIHILINSAQFRKLIEKTATGSTRKRIGLDDLKNLPLVVPMNLNEQQKIASCLSSLDDLITAQSQKIEMLKTHKKGLMQQLFPNNKD